MKRWIVFALTAALLFACAFAQEDAGMGVFPEEKKSGIKWVDQLMRRLDMPYTLVMGEDLEPEKLITWYEAAYETGCVPVIMSPNEQMSYHVLRSGSLWENRQEDLAQAEEIYQERYGSEAQRERMEISDELRNVLGFYADLNMEMAAEALFALVLVPAQEVWQLPAYLPTGGMREDIPDNAEQTVMLRHWFNQYGCLPFYWGGDNWDVYFSQMPVSALKQIALGLEMSSFCPLFEDPLFQIVLEATLQSAETNLYTLWWPEDFYGMLTFEETGPEFAF